TVPKSRNKKLFSALFSVRFNIGQLAVLSLDHVFFDRQCITLTQVNVHETPFTFSWPGSAFCYLWLLVQGMFRHLKSSVRGVVNGK
ncbi:MAG: hypothetical protein C5B49_03610, partial [Bdellovibrio sp.]